MLSLFIISIEILLCSASFKNITSVLFGSFNKGLLASFSDINSDKNVDLVTINPNGLSFKFYLMNNNKKFVMKPSINSHINDTILNIIPGDFDGDSIQDILLLSISLLNSKSMYILWGNLTHYDDPIFIAKILDLPLIIDYNGDMIPDIYGESFDDHLRYYWIASSSRVFNQILVTTEELSPLAIPNTNSFVDLNGDLIPDMHVVSQSSKLNIHQFETWINVNGKYTRKEIYSSNVFWVTNPDLKKQYEITYSGHSLLTDVNAAGIMTHICLVCMSEHYLLCKDWAILAWLPPNHDIATNHWEALYMYDWEKNDTHNQFMIDFNYTPPGSPYPNGSFPPRLSVGDFNIDGYPDLMLILTTLIDIRLPNGSIGKRFIRTPVLFQNIPCGNEESRNILKDHFSIQLTSEFSILDSVPIKNFSTLFSQSVRPLRAYNCNHLRRKFKIIQAAITMDDGKLNPQSTYTPVLSSNDYLIQDALLGAFFDLYNDGLLDVLITRNIFELNDTHTTFEPVWKDFKIDAFRNNLNLDASFVKILVLNGKCWMDCKFRAKPYGIIPPGAVIKYQTTYSKDAPTQAISCQMMQTAYFSLNLPYVIFGLGMRPNFIDKLEVGFARVPRQPPRYHSWSAIIPNSQMIIIPYPNNDMARWQHILLLVPSYFIIKIGVTLIITCLFLATIIALLQWKEKKEDFKEKMINSNQYHFDAI